jgi:hypothetical protein
MGASPERRGWRRLIEQQRGNIWVEYLILIALLGLGGVALVHMFAGSVGSRADTTGAAIDAMDSLGSSSAAGSHAGGPGAGIAPSGVLGGDSTPSQGHAGQSLHYALVADVTGGDGGGFGHWVSSFAGGLWERRGEILLGGAALVGGLVLAEASAGLTVAGGVVSLSGIGVPVGVPAAGVGALGVAVGVVTAAVGGAAIIDSIWQAASDASAESAADSSGESASSDQDLEARSKIGDVAATVELNRRRAARARAMGNEASARGYEAENEVIASLGDRVQEAGRVVSYPTDRGKVRTDIDVETDTEVIQVKSGSQLPDPNQAEATRRHAQATGKTPKVIYDPARVPPNTLRDFEQRNPDFELEPRTFGN